MKIKLVEIKDPGNKDKERVILKVLNDTDLGGYMLAVSLEEVDQSISTNLKNVMWMEDQPLKAGDLVVVYTKEGNNGKIANTDGSTSYFYYWSLTKPIGLTKDAGVLLYEVDWSFVRAIPTKVKADEFDG